MTTHQEAFLIVNLADWHAGKWPGLHGNRPETVACIPPETRPSVLQGHRGTAEAELTRLARCHPSGQFVLFTATHMAVPAEEVTHTNLRGEPMRSLKTYRIAQIDDDAPF